MGKGREGKVCRKVEDSKDPLIKELQVQGVRRWEWGYLKTIINSGGAANG